MFYQLLGTKNGFFGWFWAFLAPKIFFIGLLVFSLKGLENFYFLCIFQFLTKKIKKMDFFNRTFWALQWPKMIFFAWLRFHAKVQSILNFFGPGHFVHTTFPFGCRSPWKMRFWDKFDIFQKITFVALKTQFALSQWVFARFWPYRTQKFRNLFYFSNLLKNLKLDGLNKPKLSKIDFGLF